jgi:hypothetical protein
MQALQFAVSEDIHEELSVGLAQPLTSPYNLFLNLDQLINDDKVDFFIYSIGAERKILWGVYDKLTRSFQIDSGCEYIPRQLYEITLNWTRFGFKYVGNTVVNRPQKLIQEYLGKLPDMDYEDYTQLKYLEAYLLGEITEEEYRYQYGSLPLIPEEPNEYYDYFTNLQQTIQQFEKNLNRLDLNRMLLHKLTPSLKREVERITESFRNAVATGNFSQLPQCPTYEECIVNPTESCQLYFFTEPDFT